MESIDQPLAQPQPQPLLDGAMGWQLGSDWTLRWEGLHWPAGAWLQFPVHHRGATISQLLVELWVADEETPRLTAFLGTMPGVFCHLGIDAAWLDAQRVFFPRSPGRLKATSFGRRLRPEEVSAITLRCCANDWGQETVVGEPQFTTEPSWPVRGPVLSDALGQRADVSWPGKLNSLAEVQAQLAVPPAAPLPGRGPWGGDGVAVAEPGFFRTWRDGSGRWWLLDPEGQRFFSAGLDCVRPEIQAAVVPGTEALFGWLPPRKHRREGGFWSRGQNDLPIVDFASALLAQAWGEDWHRQWCDRTSQLMRSWGFNTVANWSDMTMARGSGLPYTVNLKGYPRTELMLFRDLPDVFDPAFAEASGAWAQTLAADAGSPAFIGYFLGNEPAWAFGAYNLAAEMLEDHPGSHSRRAFADFLRQRYAHDAALAAAWDGLVPDFAAIIDATLSRVADRSTQAAADCWEFSHQLAERYLSIPAAAAKAVAPQHLCLGIRWAWISSELCYCGAKSVDVFSINCYQFAIPDDILAEISERVDLPVMIGEFHFGTIDRGLPATGLKAVANQEARGQAYSHFVEQAAADPRVVGTHYFTLYDQHCLGRFDGENFQIGLLDITQRPYEPFIDALRACHARLYAVARGECPPQAESAAEASRVSF